MDNNMQFKAGAWCDEINVSNFVQTNLTPYYGDASFLEKPTERTLKVWNKCLEAIEEERARGGVRALDNKTVSTITSHKPPPLSRQRAICSGVLRTGRAKPARATSTSSARRPCSTDTVRPSGASASASAQLATKKSRHPASARALATRVAPKP